MRCSVCNGTLSLSVVSITVYDSLTYTVTLCHNCQDKLWGAENTQRLQRLTKQLGWKQERLPSF